METSRKISRQEIHLRDYLAVLNRRKWIIIVALVITVSVTVLYMRKQIPLYQAQASIIIEPNRTQGIVSPHSVQTISPDLRTQIEVIKTTPVLASVVKQLGLTKDGEGTPKFSQAVGFLKRSIRTGFVGDTSMVSIAAIHSIPTTAQAIANTVAQAYIDQDRLSRLQSGRDAVRWLSMQLADLKTKLKHSEEVFQQFKERESMITLDNKRREELNEIYQLNSAYLKARTERLEVEAIIDRLESESHALERGEEGVDLKIPISLLNSPMMQRLGDELSQLGTELADKRRLFKDTYPGIIETKDRIQLTEQKILTELKRQRDFLQAQENSFSTLQKTRYQEALKLSRKELEYLTLEREVTTNREIYNALLSRVKELSLAGESDLNNIRIVEPAQLPLAPMSSKNLTLPLGGILGLFLGIGFAFFLEYLENTIKTPDDVEQHLELPVLGVIPRVADAKQSQVPPIILREGPENAPAEAYRNLRTNLVLSRAENPLKAIMFTSAGPGEGKSLTAVNLAVALAQTGRNVLLVDADLRRPVLHQVFDLNRDRGLSTVLAGELALSEAVVKTDITNLSVLNAGISPANPSELLGSAQMRDLIGKVREQYDMVLFDSAPIAGMADARVLGSEIDGALLVIKAGEATRKALKALINQSEQVGAQICGVVLNNVDVRRYEYYDYYYYFPYEDYKEKGLKRKKVSGEDGVKRALDKLFMESPNNLIKLVTSTIEDKSVDPTQVRKALKRIWNQVSEVDVTSASESSSESVPSDKTRVRGRAYSEEHHIEGKPQEVVELFKAIDKFCRKLDPTNVQRKYLARYINYTCGTSIFCCVCLRKSGLRVYLRLNYSDLGAPPQYVRDVSNIRHCGVGDVELAINSLERLQDASVFVQESFEESKSLQENKG